MTTLSGLVPRAYERHCPHCESPNISRSNQQGIWALPVVRLLRIHRYRCTTCWRYFHGVGRTMNRARVL